MQERIIISFLVLILTVVISTCVSHVNNAKSNSPEITHINTNTDNIHDYSTTIAGVSKALYDIEMSRVIDVEEVEEVVVAAPYETEEDSEIELESEVEEVEINSESEVKTESEAEIEIEEEEEHNVIKIGSTAYYNKYNRSCADGTWPTPGVLAGKKEWLGKSCYLYDLDMNLLGEYTFHDVGYGKSTGKGKSRFSGRKYQGDIEAGLTIDIFMNKKSECIEWGRQDVYLEWIEVENEDEK